VGHWQVMPHPSRSGWTRLLYSCKVKLLPWIPEFVVSFLTTKALTEVEFGRYVPCLRGFLCITFSCMNKNGCRVLFYEWLSWRRF
jgi:hypothetical protein